MLPAKKYKRLTTSPQSINANRQENFSISLTLENINLE